MNEDDPYCRKFAFQEGKTKRQVSGNIPDLASDHNGYAKNGDTLSDKSITSYLKERRRQRKLAFAGPHSAW